MSQCDRIVDYMKQFGSITSMEAFNDLGCTRLAARISDLENRGMKINKKQEHGVNRFGQKTSFTRYSISAENVWCP